MIKVGDSAAKSGPEYPLCLRLTSFLAALRCISPSTRQHPQERNISICRSTPQFPTNWQDGTTPLVRVFILGWPATFWDFSHTVPMQYGIQKASKIMDPQVLHITMLIAPHADVAVVLTANQRGHWNETRHQKQGEPPLSMPIASTHPGAALRGCGRCDRTGPPKIGGLQKFLYVMRHVKLVISNIFAYKPAHLDVERDSDHLSI